MHHFKVRIPSRVNVWNTPEDPSAEIVSRIFSDLVVVHDAMAHLLGIAVAAVAGFVVEHLQIL